MKKIDGGPFVDVERKVPSIIVDRKKMAIKTTALGHTTGTLVSNLNCF
jgi:hypothetical protein